MPAARQASLSITSSRSPPKPMSIEPAIPSNHLILCCPLLLLLSIFPSIRIFSNESALCIRWPKYWSFSCNISPSNEHPGLIPFRMDWLDLLAVQGTLKSLLQHHSSKASIPQCSAFFTVQLSHPYMTTGIPGVGDGQGGLVCCDSWGGKESGMTERLNWTELMISKNQLLVLLIFAIVFFISVSFFLRWSLWFLSFASWVLFFFLWLL